jgi:hypothetical protein
MKLREVRFVAPVLRPSGDMGPTLIAESMTIERRGDTIVATKDGKAVLYAWAQVLWALPVVD